MKVLPLQKKPSIPFKNPMMWSVKCLWPNEYDVLVGANHIKYKLNNGPLTNGQENKNHTEKKYTEP